MGHVARQIKQASIKAGIGKRITSHCLRHSFATHSLENGVPIHVVQRLMGHTDIRTTEGYLHLSKDGATAAKSPLEALLADPSLATRRDKPNEDLSRLRIFAG
jgi:integrase